MLRKYCLDSLGLFPPAHKQVENNCLKGISLSNKFSGKKIITKQQSEWMKYNSVNKHIKQSLPYFSDLMVQLQLISTRS